MAASKKRSSYPLVKPPAERKTSDLRHSTALVLEEPSESLSLNSTTLYSDTEENSLGNDDIHDILSILQTKFRKKTHDQQKAIQSEIQATLHSVSKLILDQVGVLEKDSESKIRAHRSLVEDTQLQHGNLLRDLKSEYEASQESFRSKLSKLESMQKKIEDSNKALQSDLEGLRTRRKAQVMQEVEKLQKEAAALKQRLSAKVAHKNHKYKNIRESFRKLL